MYRIEAESVEVVFLDPVECVVDEEIAHHSTVAAIEINRFSPGSLMALGEEIRSVLAQIISLRAKVVVDHVQEDHQFSGVSGLD